MRRFVGLVALLVCAGPAWAATTLLSTELASPPAIGGTTPNVVSATAVNVSNGGTIGPVATTSGHTVILRGYDNDGAAWLSFLSCANGNTPTCTLLGNFDGSGATFTFGSNFSLPNGTDPAVDAAGEIAVDTDGANVTGDVSVRMYDGSGMALLARKLHCFQATVIKPQDLADTERDLFPMWSNETGMVFTITSIKGWSDTDNTTVTVEEVTATDWSAPGTVDALEIATDSTSVFTVTETTITGATIEAGNLLTLDFDDTDDPGVVKVTACGWFNADID